MNKKMLKASAFATCMVLTGTVIGNTVSVSADDTPYRAEFNVNMSGEKKEISPYIYGVNDHADVKKVTPTAIRQGGNRYSAYNWETNYSNAGSDWKHSSDTHLSASSTPGDCAMKLSKKCNDIGVDYKFTTLQMLGYVSADKNGTVSEDEAAPSKRWLEVKNRKDGELSLTPDTTDNAVYMDEYVNYLVKTLGDSTTSEGIQGYSLDNEPALWSHTHSLVHGNPVGMKELVDKSIDLASVVKDIDPNADVYGPALWGFPAYKQLADDDNSDEWETIKEEGGYNWFVDYYLDEMKKASDEYGSRLIDCLDIHYYAQAAQINGTQEDILQGVRTLYEEGFKENSWIGEMIDWAPQDLPIIPNLKNSIDKYYPGTKLTISEYDFYGRNSIEGAIVEAEALGCFANNDIYLATYWGEENSPYTFAGINLYTNYDGNGSSFGDTLLETSIEDSSKSNAYASVHSDDSTKVDIVITNKSADSDEIAEVNLQNSDKEFKSGVVYGIVDGSTDIIVMSKIDDIKDNSFEVNLPSLSVVHVVVSEDADAFKDIDIYDPSDKPVMKEVKIDAADLSKGENGYYVNVENPDKIKKIQIETELKPSDGSSWYTAGGAVCFTINTATSNNQWAFKGFTASKGAETVEIEMDGLFTVPINDTENEEMEGVLASPKFEFQTWWSASELDGDVGLDIKSITLLYEDNSAPEVTEPVVTTTTEETTVTTSETTLDTPTETTSSENNGNETSESIPAPSASMLGDANCDNQIDLRDVTIVAQHIVKMVELTETGCANADVIKDNVVDVKDLSQIKKYLIKVISEF